MKKIIIALAAGLITLSTQAQWSPSGNDYYNTNYNTGAIMIGQNTMPGFTYTPKLVVNTGGTSTTSGGTLFAVAGAATGDGRGRFHFSRPATSYNSYECFLSFDNGGTYQWVMGMDNETTNNFNIFYNTGRALTIGTNKYLGLGMSTTNSPSERLHVNGNAVFMQTEALSSNSSAYIVGLNGYSDGGSPDYTWLGDINTGMLHPYADNIGFTTNGTERLRIVNNGYVGIGTVSPSVKLDVEDATNADARFFTTSNNSTKVWAMNNIYSYALGIDNTGMGHIYENVNSSGGVPVLNFNQGKVWIGNPSGAFTGGPHQSNYSLAVEGKIVAQEIYVTINDWADYVFEPNYKLLSLDSLENYITINKHLPNVPTTEEVMTNGNNTGETDRILLEKIEELTLYLLIQEKRIKELENKLLKN